ncbi:MAG TPA: M1 family aminopeptidase [Rhizomicrobium sp.]|nr:M1 family aminopeptidase [Rhizomicrobium sp.]
MFAKIAGFEARYQMRSPVFWVAGIIFFLLSFAATTISQVQVGSVGNVWKNSPYAILQVSGVLDVFFVFALVAFVANIVVRDDETGYGPIVRSTRITKFDYLFGRFTGAFGAALVMALAIPLGILVGSFMPWVDPQKLGPFHAEHYLYDVFVMMLPTLFVLGAAFFALATATRSMMGTYVGAVGFLVAYLVLTVLFQKPQYDHIVGILEPFGMGALQEIVKYWTTSDRNTMLPPLAEVMLINRAIYLGLAFVLLGAAYWSFRFETRGARAAKAERPEPAVVRARASGPLPAPHFDRGSVSVLAWKWTRFEMGQVFKSPAFFVLLALGLLNALGSLFFATERNDWTVLPVTNLMIAALNGAFTIIPLVVAIYYAGELVWRERDRHTHEVLGAVPVPDWAFVVPKIAAVSFVLASMLVISAVTAAIVQAIKGYTNFEGSHYLLWYIVPNTFEAMELAALAVFVQTVSPHKYIGWGVMALVQVMLITFANIGYDHHLYLFGTSYEVPLSDMNGQGQFWIGRAWFQVYWLSFSLILSILAYGLWRRGTETRFLPRLARLPQRMRGSAGVLMALAVIVWAGAGAYIYYNTNILNEHRTTVADEAWTADYERALYRFHTVPQPRVTDLRLNVAIYPHDLRVETSGWYRIVNSTNKPMPAVHVRWVRDLRMDSLAVAGAHPTQRFDRFNYRIYTFDRPLAPGAASEITFRTVWEQRGFKNSGNLTRIVDNGTFVNNTEIAPLLGIDQSMLLKSLTARRRQHLTGEMRPRKLEDPEARWHGPFGDTNWVNSDITVSTVADQTPIAPGYKVSDVIRDGRRTARFKSDAPLLAFFSMQSAAYAEKHAKWRDVDLTVYYDPHHPYQIDRMLSSMKASLDVFDRAFGPYQFRQARILEFPGYATFAQSFANTIPFSESIGFIQDDAAIRDDSDKIDLVTFVTAHELGHQWWGHQLTSADMQGGTMLIETMAQYSAMLVMEHLYGPDHVRKFLKAELDAYLRSRGSEEVEELPLDRVEDQGYIHYRKGAVVMYRLKETVGEAAVDRALRRMLKTYAFKGAPYPTTLDFLKVLREEVGPKYDQLITDLFEKITLYDLRAESATWSKRSDGRYDVDVTVDAHKYYADGRGKQTEVRMDEPVNIGLFTARPGDADFGKRKVLVMMPLRIVSGTQTLHLVTAVAPKFAGIDPYNMWIDRNSDDNVVDAAPGHGS